MKMLNAATLAACCIDFSGLLFLKTIFFCVIAVGHLAPKNLAPIFFRFSLLAKRQKLEKNNK